jgi:uncharacterized protein with HEPN domain
MLDFSLSAVSKLNSVSKDQYLADDTLQLASAHLIQTIGEAARLVSNDFKSSHPEIPWSQITGMRHKIFHDYFSIDMDIVWDVVKVELPLLIPKLEELLKDPK